MASTVFSCQLLFVLVTVGCGVAVWGYCSQPGLAGPACRRYDYAYQKHADQKNWMFSSEAVLPPNNAVNGSLSRCSRTDNISDPWWSVDLGQNYVIEGVTITAHTSSEQLFKNFLVEVSAGGPWEPCFAWNRTYTPSFADTPCEHPVLGRSVRITVLAETKAVLSLCDVGVYGECDNGTFGNYCNNKCGDCFNETICRKQDGYCLPSGKCEAGFISPLCIEKCPWGKYGAGCLFDCGNCRNTSIGSNATCNVFIGHCPARSTDCPDCPEVDLCEPGYKEPLCQEACDPYFYGYGCQPCGACDREICDRVTGHCTACEIGYKNIALNAQCTIPCDDGTWGLSCKDYCGQCWNTSEGGHSVPCNKLTGVCDDTCAPGYKTSQSCHDPCDEGTYGPGCSGVCGNCGKPQNGQIVSVPCMIQDGTCRTGCLMGWQGSGCKEHCTKGTWDLNCEKACEHCDDCDAYTGVCVMGTCIAGWQGNLCDQECPAGKFGIYCGHVCSENCQDRSSCNRVDGSCNCKDGWTGLLCSEKCAADHWGHDCSQACGHCAGGGCQQSDGQCRHGCDQDWQGPQCTIIVAPSEYKKDYGAIIGGTIGGFIALVLIAILVAYIVWSWRTGTPMNPQQFVRAARLSLRASQKFARASIDRLSMRRRRQQQERQKLAKTAGQDIHNGGHIEVTETSGAIHKMIYESVGLPCNNIHRDDFQRIYLQLQEVDGHGRTALYESFRSFLRLLTDVSTASSGGADNKAYYNGGNNVQLEVANTGDVPMFLPLGSNLSGFLLVKSSASSDIVWQHVQQRQIETVITVGKGASVSWRPRERVTIGNDTIECVDVQKLSSHTENKLTIQKMNAAARRAIRHFELSLWEGQRYPNVSTVLMFMERFQQIAGMQRGRSILINFVTQHDQAVLFTIIASAFALMTESGRVDILRAVNMGGSTTTKVMRTFENFKYLHDVFFHHIAMEITKRGPPPAVMTDTMI